ncbi:M14 family zinc carboxypeptidase [Micromonospora sp. NPDC050686]|uniref:M14 family zinc carboxypeptidase n=1 Tax=Micromonospora sp. NPDC050686 TaxID=3154631 RepID=UPI0033D4030E
MAALYRVTHLKRKADIDAVARTGAAIEHVEHGELTVSATPAEVRAITRLGLRTVPLAGTPELGTLDFPAADAAYHNHAETLAAVDAIVAAHPGIARKQVIGTSYEGRAIVALKISDNVGTDESEPEVLFTANQHAREHLTVEQALFVADLLTGQYGTDARITRLVDSREFWIVPMVNPDGVEYDVATGVYQSWRKNRQPNTGSKYVGTDLNRNWGYKWGCCAGSSTYPSSDTFRGSAAFSAPETRAVRDFVLGRRVGGVQQIKAAIDFHAFSELVLWPFGYTTSDVAPGMTADQNLMFTTIGQQLAATNGYTPEQASDLYLTDGTINDWLWGDQGVVNFTFELYPTDDAINFYPPASVIPAQTARNREAVLMFSEYADCPYRAIGKASTYCPAADDFSMATSPSTGSVTAGGSVTTTVTTTVTAGSAQSVTLSAGGLPPGASAIFFPPTITAGQSATMTVTAGASTAPASYAVTVTGTGSGVTRSTRYALDVDGRPGCSASNDTDLAIPELATVASPVTVTGCGGNAGAASSVEVHIVHPYIGDLMVSLVAPDGTEYVLHNRAGGGADNIDKTFPVDLSSEGANGTWYLKMSDAATGDTGYLDRWKLSL